MLIGTVVVSLVVERVAGAGALVTQAARPVTLATATAARRNLLIFDTGFSLNRESQPGLWDRRSCGAARGGLGGHRRLNRGGCAFRRGAGAVAIGGRLRVAHSAVGADGP